MRSLLTGYAGAFNRRHKRVGHLFQNRYKSIVVEEEPYLLELVRYLHLNPLRAQVVPDLGTLDRYPWTGHSALLGTVPRALAGDRHHPRPVRGHPAPRPAGLSDLRRRRPPRRAAGPSSRAADCSGATGAGPASATLRRGREAYQGDERILGSSDFVEEYRRAIAAATPGPSRLSLDTLCTRVCRHVGVPLTALAGGGRTPALTRARAGIAYLWVDVLGRAGRALAPTLGVHPSAIPKAARRGAGAAAVWRRLLGHREKS